MASGDAKNAAFMMMMAGRVWNAVPIHIRIVAIGDDGGCFGARAPCAAGPSIGEKIEAENLQKDQARGSDRDACAR
ncbi:MAG: hypothetical protein FD139_2753 [Methylocystaceae bacterium]|nr:MAG: hypothetical protein FD148_109 [Methylocystaceae bacterium]TXT43671.1 MAG: hypothetical protein FD139_2753 [Methylocystaceae bacterium]